MQIVYTEITADNAPQKYHICETCGSIVARRGAHSDWHKNAETIYSVLKDAVDSIPNDPTTH